MDESFQTVEYRDSNDGAEPGWYVLLVDEDGEEFDQIGPFESKGDAESAHDLMDYEEAA